MKRTLVILALVLAAPALAGESPLGTIAATTTAQNNATTAVPFDVPEGAKISVQCDAAGYVLTGKTSAVTASSSNAVKVSADALYDTSTPLDGTLSGTKAYVSVVAVSGSINCKVFLREGNEG